MSSVAPGVRIPKQRYTRVIPVAFVMYLIAYIDRNNIGFAFQGMEHTLHLSPTLAGTAGGMFFLGYVILQIPCGYIASRFGAVKLVFFFQLVWGILAICTGLVTNATELLICRFLLGMAESALFPCTLVILSRWFPLKERARANGYWQVSSTVAGIIMGPISGLIVASLTWKWLFILEGLPAIIWAIVWRLTMVDTPQKSKFLSQEEKEYLDCEFAEDAKNYKPVSNNWKEALANKQVWLLTIVYLLMNTGFYGYYLWLPTVMQSVTHSGIGRVGLLTALPNIASIVGLVLLTRHSDKTKERKWHGAFALIGAAVMLGLSVVTVHVTILSMIFLILTLGVSGGFGPVFWSVTPTIVSESALGPTMGLINGVGNLGGFFGPTIIGYLITQTHSPMVGLVFSALMWIIAGLVMLVIRIKKANTPQAGTSITMTH